jgi:hypothetical protein
MLLMYFCRQIHQNSILLLPFFLILLKNALASNEFVGCGTDAEKAVSQCLDPMLAYANAIQLADGPNGHRQFSLQGPQVFHRLCALYADFKAIP